MDKISIINTINTKNKCIIYGSRNVPLNAAVINLFMDEISVSQVIKIRLIILHCIAFSRKSSLLLINAGFCHRYWVLVIWSYPAQEQIAWWEHKGFFCLERAPSQHQTDLKQILVQKVPDWWASPRCHFVVPVFGSLLFVLVYFLLQWVCDNSALVSSVGCYCL